MPTFLVGFAAKAIGLLLLIVVIVGGVWYYGHTRYAAAQALDRVGAAQALSARVALDAKNIAAEVTVAQHIGDLYDAALLTPVSDAPVYRLFVASPVGAVQVPGAGGSGASHDDAPSLPGAGQVGTPATWDSAPILKVSADADAQVTALQTYIRQVCKPQGYQQ